MDLFILYKTDQMKDKINLRFGALAGIVGLATVVRIATPPLLGHPSNFAPIGALAIFSGCYFSGRITRLDLHRQMDPVLRRILLAICLLHCVCSYGCKPQQECKAAARFGYKHCRITGVFYGIKFWSMGRRTDISAYSKRFVHLLCGRHSFCRRHTRWRFVLFSFDVRGL
jgi:hypothetical protein